MTIVNVVCYQDRALLAADSVMCAHGHRLIRQADGTPAEDRKLVYLPAAHCVISMTGSLHLREHLREHLQDAAGFDDCVDRAPQILRQAPHFLTANVQSRYPRGNSAIVVGFSVRSGCMCAADFVMSREYEPALHVPSGPHGFVTWRSPGIDLPPFFGWPEDADGMLRLALLQVAKFRGEHADAPLGGVLTVCELTRTAITYTRAGDLGLPTESRLEPTCN